MNTKDEIALIETNLASVNAEEEGLRAQRESYQTQLAFFIRRLIKEEKLLGKCEWTVSVGHKNRFTLHTHVRDEGIKELVKLIDKAQSHGWYHFKFDLLDGDGAVLFNDSNVDMYFEDAESLSRICEEYGLKFDTKQIDKEIKDSTDKANRYTEIKKQIEKYSI